jgi:Pectate lyase superfamily protein
MTVRGCIQIGLLGFLIVAAVSCPGTATPWRSALYPADWTPAHTDTHGRFLHDFSYAGYRNGEEPLPTVSGPLFDVTDFGADITGAADATAAIQSAIDAASAAGGVVYLPAGLYRCDGRLRVAAPGVVLRGDGSALTRLYFTQAEGMSGKGHLAFQGSVSREADILLTEDGENRSNVVKVADATGLAVGDETSLGWVITDEFIDEHAMTGTWQAFNGTWRPIFRRTITAIDTIATPHTLTLDIPLRYPAKVRDSASLRKESGYLEGCGIEDLAVSTAVAWDAAWAEVRTHAIVLQGVKDCWVTGVESFPSPLDAAKGYHLQNGGIKVIDAKRVTVADCRMQKAQNRGGGGCGYLFEVSKSNEVLYRDCVAAKGRHNFIQNWDFGTTGCVWLRCSSSGSRNILASADPIGLPAYSEFHHSLAMACLIDQCTLADGWYAGNRKDWSSGAGHTITQSVFWNTNGGGRIRSWQYGTGYVIGTSDITIQTTLYNSSATGTAPEDYVEGKNQGAGLEPSSLYESQLTRRLAR